jgi:hypothetical protein
VVAWSRCNVMSTVTSMTASARRRPCTFFSQTPTRRSNCNTNTNSNCAPSVCLFPGYGTRIHCPSRLLLVLKR